MTRTLPRAGLLALLGTAVAISLTAQPLPSGAIPADQTPDRTPVPTADLAVKQQPAQWREVFSSEGRIVQRLVQPEPTRPDPGVAALAEAAKVTPIGPTGPSDKRLDLVVVGDGYTAAELDDYRADVEARIDDLFAVEPYLSYRESFNVWMVDVTSRQSGIDNDPRGVRRDTAMDSYFYCGNIARLVCIDSKKANTFAAAAPQVDQVIAVVNSSTFGGSGGGVATVSGSNASSGDIAIHELGHSIGGLADEYGAGDGLPCSTSEFEEPNASLLTRAEQEADQTKWWRWMGERSPDGGLTDTFEGAAYCDTGAYRPSSESVMRVLGNEFNLPSREAMIAAFARKAPPAVAERTADGTFVVEPLVAGGSQEITWEVDGLVQPDASGATSFAPPPTTTAGAQVVTVRVVDQTPWVRDPAVQELLTFEQSWTVGD